VAKIFLSLTRRAPTCLRRHVERLATSWVISIKYSSQLGLECSLPTNPLPTAGRCVSLKWPCRSTPPNPRGDRPATRWCGPRRTEGRDLLLPGCVISSFFFFIFGGGPFRGWINPLWVQGQAKRVAFQQACDDLTDTFLFQAPRSYRRASGVFLRQRE
jgi:hypothetical protein